MFPQPMIMMQQPRGYSRRRSSKKKKLTSYKGYKKLLSQVKQARALKKALVATAKAGTVGSTRYDAFGEDKSKANEIQKLMRGALKYSGKGDYWDDIQSFGKKWVPKGTFSHLGGAVGDMWGHKSLGAGLGSALSRFVGFGDYAGDAGGNQLMGGSVATPMTVNGSSDLTGDIYFSHREFLQNIQATGGSGNISTFSLSSFSLNPGLVQTFPFLSQIAENFVLYEPEGIIFEYKPTSGEFGATGNNALGKVVMATQYDPDAPAFTSSVQMENYDYSNACKPSEHMLHGVETAGSSRSTNLLYIRTGSSPKDKVLTDIGTFMIATEGLPITSGTVSTIGELWVSYRFRLSRAQLFGSFLGNSTLTDVHFANTTTGATVGNTNPFTAGYYTALQNYFTATGLAASQWLPKLTNTIGCVVTGVNATDFQVTFPSNIVQGTYLIAISAVTTASTFSSPVARMWGAQNLVNAALRQQTYSTSSIPLLGLGTITTTPTSVTESYCVAITAPGTLVASVQFRSVYYNAANFNIQVQVTQVPSLVINV